MRHVSQQSQLQEKGQGPWIYRFFHLSNKGLQSQLSPVGQIQVAARLYLPYFHSIRGDGEELFKKQALPQHPTVFYFYCPQEWSEHYPGTYMRTRSEAACKSCT